MIIRSFIIKTYILSEAKDPFDVNGKYQKNMNRFFVADAPQNGSKIINNPEMYLAFEH